MTKIDESKQYKFSEIIAMLENKELPIGACVFNPQGDNYNVKKSTLNYFGLAKKQHIPVQAIISAKDINDLWSIELPKEERFYLTTPGCFDGEHTLNQWLGKYSFVRGRDAGGKQSRFTQKQIDDIPFDTTFFEKVKAEQADE
ncbi:hypothetical protein [Carnobacterium maltaromaticum]|uniref:hypothetical protein n=1 Tax=Carnobacterium maltaromaticum TaxID=2751 RepID=UPI000550A046|nr:hypothetical protein [Carnobacterium maltaromaticum]KRN66297.1 hypothetical protein IV70_GL001850 [Carnobacterium maltaromaticum DSM 20342]